MNDMGVAVVGAGFIGPVHVEGLRRAGVVVRGILGISDQESTQAAASLGIPRAYKSFDEVLADFDRPGRTHRHPKSPALRPVEACPGGGQARHVRKAPGHELPRIGRSGGPGTQDQAGRRRELQSAFLPAVSPDGARWSAAAGSATCSPSAAAMFRTGCCIPTDYNWRVLAEEGGDSAPWPISARTGSTWCTFVTGLEVEAVCADLATVHPVRQRPKGEVETFNGKVEQVRQTEPVQISTEDYGCIMLRFAGGGRGVLWVSQVTAGRKNCLRVRDCRLQAVPGVEQRIAQRAVDRPPRRAQRDHCSATRPWSADSVRPYIAYPGGHNEGFPDTFKQCFRAFYGYIAAGRLQRPAHLPHVCRRPSRDRPLRGDCQ